MASGAIEWQPVSKLDKAENMSVPIKTVVGYTADPWESALAVLRLAHPLKLAGIELLQGNQGDQVSPELVSQADLVVIQRDFPRFTAAYDEILHRARAEKKPLVYEIDDLLVAVSDAHPNYRAYWDVLLPILRTMIQADLVTVSTPEMAARLSFLNPNILILPNYLDDSLWSFRDVALRETGPVVVSYMGGQTHREDLEEIEKVLVKISTEYADSLLLRFVGAKPPDSLIALPNVDWVSCDILDYQSFAHYFSSLPADIYIAPLRDTAFNRCKSSIKFLEYSVQGVPGIYSRTSPYQQVVIHGENGLLASSAVEWENALRLLIQTPEKRFEMGRKAQQTVKQDWLLSSNYAKWLAGYQQAREAAHSRPQAYPDSLEMLLDIAHTTETYLDNAEQANVRLTQLEQAGKLQIQEQQRQIQEQQYQLGEQGKRIQEHQRQIEEQAQLIEHWSREYSISHNQLQDIYHSRSWRLMKVFHKVRNIFK